MKVEVREFENCFSIDMTAENVADAAVLARIGVNATKELRSVNIAACESGEFGGSVVIGKAKNSTDYIERS